VSTLRALEPSRRVADHSASNRFLLLAEYSDREPIIRADVEVFNVHLLSIRAPTGAAPGKGTSAAHGQALMTAPIWGVDGPRMPHTPEPTCGINRSVTAPFHSPVFHPGV